MRHVSGDHRGFLESALGAAAQHQHAGGVLGVGDFPDFHLLVLRPVWQQFKAAGGKFVFILLATAAGDVDQIRIAQLSWLRAKIRPAERMIRIGGP